MVNNSLSLDLIFGSLSHPVRRDILQRGMREVRTVGQIAEAYDMTLAAISKHLKILEKAKLIIKRRRGKQQLVQVAPAAFKDASVYLRRYEKLWNERLDSLELYLSSLQDHGHKSRR